MLRNEPLLGALRSFVTAMSTDYDLASTSLELSVSSAAALSAAGAGVSVADLAGNLRLVAATDHRVIEIEQAQEEAQQGPCVNAFQSQKVVTASGPDALGEWPAVAAAAQRLGFSSAMGVPLSSGDTRVGALSWARGGGGVPAHATTRPTEQSQTFRTRACHRRLGPATPAPQRSRRTKPMKD